MTNSGRFDNLDCPVEAGEECVMPQRRGWGIDRSINPVYVGVLATIMIGLLVWAGGPTGVNAHFQQLDTTIIQHEKEDRSLHESQDRLERRTEERQKSIEDKLDRLIERGRK